MILRRSRNIRRSAFTLIELLVVIAIIAILVSLSAAGVMKVLFYIPQVQTRTDISQMDAALGSFMADYQQQDPPLSSLTLSETLQGDTRSNQFLFRLFGKNLGAGTASAATGGKPWVDWNGDGKINGPWTLEGEQCLVFYLGGIQTIVGGTPQCLGFSTNNNNPAQAGGSRKGPYFNFLPSRLILGSVYTNPVTKLPLPPFFVYLDAWKPASGVQQPYAYFSSYGINNGYTPTDCLSIPGGCKPYWTAQTAMGVPTVYTNSNKYQIISAGEDGVFGGGLWIPSSGAVGAGRDDQANFSSKTLGAGQQ